MKWAFILLLICVLLSFHAAFMAWQFFYLAQGIRPLIVDEPNIWIARVELVFSLAIVVLGFIGIYAITRLKGVRKD